MTASADERLSIIIPVLNEAVGIPDLLTALKPYRDRGVEVIVADGGSSDQTVKLALPLCDQVVTAPRGRGAQMNAGAAAARGDILLFLHADTALPADADRLVREGLASGDRAWGRFDVNITGTHWLLPIVAFMMSLRSRVTGITTGDQAMFVRRDAFALVGGFPDIPLMEDIVLSQRLKRLTPPLCLRERVTTSGRRWEKNGVVRTIVLMWRLRLAFYLGAKPDELARDYGYVPRDA
jgi:rSAM/selenodomain-associated transferase 2